MWSLVRGILLSAQYFPGEENVRAVVEFRDERPLRLEAESLDLSKDTGHFSRPQYQSLHISTGIPTSVLFQLEVGPIMEAADVFLQDWRGEKAFSNPPWYLVGWVLIKVGASGRSKP